MNDSMLTMGPAQMVLAAFAMPLAMAYVCRLSALSWSTARARYVLLHLFGLFYCGAVMFMHPDGMEVVGETMGLGICACWLWVSYPTWKNGPPPHVSTAPAPFSDTAAEPQPTYILGQHKADSRWLQ